MSIAPRTCSQRSCTCIVVQDPPSWDVNTQDSRALFPLAAPRASGIVSRPSPGPPLRPGPPSWRTVVSEDPGWVALVHPYLGTGRESLPLCLYCTSLSGFPHFGSSRSHLCRHKLSGSTGRSRSLAQLTQAHLLPWNDLVPSSPVSSHSRTNQASSGGAVYSVCRRLQKATSDLPVASREKWCGPTDQGYRPSSRRPLSRPGVRHRGVLRPLAR